MGVANKIILSWSRQRKKQRIILVSALLIVLVMIPHVSNAVGWGRSGVWGNPVWWFIIVVSQATLAWWVFEFDLRWREAIFFLLPPILFAMTVAVVVSNLKFSLASYLVLGVLFALSYVLLAALNIINVSTIRTVPLKKAAFSSLFFVGILMSFLAAYYLLKGADLWGFIGFGLLLDLFSVSFLFLSAEEPWLHFAESTTFIVLSSEALVISNLFPASSHMVLVVFLTGIHFVLLGYLYHHLNKSLRSAITREYFFISLVLLAVWFWL